MEEMTLLNLGAGLDPLNVFNGSNNIYTVGELTGLTTEVPYPSREINSPPGQQRATYLDTCAPLG